MSVCPRGELPGASEGAKDPRLPGRSAETTGDRRLHFTLFGKSSRGFFGKDEIVIETDLEDPVPTLDQGGLEIELLSQRIRQTGGSGFVVSSHAVFDPNRSHFRILQDVGTAGPASPVG